MRFVRFSLTFLLMTVTLASARAADESIKSFNIPAQPLAEALADFSRQSDVIVLAPSDLTGDKISKPVTGDMPPAQALERLLDGTDLHYVMERDGSVILQGQVTRTEREAATGSITLAQTETAASADPSDSENKNDELEEVVVTAQKRKELLKDVPISISVLSGTDLDKSTVQGMTEALSRVPGVAVNEGLQGGGTQLAIRGITASQPLFGGSSPIAYYIDSIPFGLIRSAVAPDPSAYDLDRVEVLRGPQGTLYGASGQGGVVRLLTKDANPGEFEFKARTSVSATEDGGDNHRGDLAVNVPVIADKLAVRAVLGYTDLGGWVDSPNKNKINDAQLRNLRFKVNAQPTENLSIGFSTWIARNDYGAPSVSDGDGKTSFTIDQFIATDYTTYGLDVNYRFDGFSISSRTGYLEYSNRGDLDFGVPFYTALDSSVLSQEVLLNSANESPWQWSLGAFYRDAEDRTFQTLTLPPPTNVFGLADFADFSRSYAVFGELHHRFFHDRLKWTLGVRYFYDDGSTKGEVKDLNRYFSTAEAVTPRAVLAWTPSDNLSIYGSYAQGFRSGLPQDELVTSLAPFFPPVKPDKLHNYELGAKGSFLNQLISFEAALYYFDWKDIQQVLLVPVPNAVNLNALATVNGTSASGMGFDIAVATHPARGLELGVSFSTNDLKQDEDVISNNALLFKKGDRLNISPEYTIGAFTEYTFKIGGSGFEGRFSGSYNYTSPLNSAKLNGPGLISHPMQIGRASFSIATRDHWNGTVYIDNIGDEYDSPAPNFDRSPRIRPRTIGVQFEYRY